MRSDNDVLGMIFAEQRSLHLESAELAFLVAILASSRASIVPELADAAVEDLFVQVKTAFDPTSENPRRSATNSIASLRQQKLLTRIDAAGMSAAGSFALTPLGNAIAAAFLDQGDVLDKTNLSALGAALRAHLGQAHQKAQQAATPDAWREVIQDLRTTGHELVGGISRRAAALDVAQEAIRDKIGSLLEADWFGAVATCEELLDETARTLAELAEILLRDTDYLVMLLQEIGESADRGGAAEAAEAALELSRGVDRTAARATHRQIAWSDYYQYVQRFLRDVVRLDPARALSQRLRDVLRSYPDCDWTYVLARPDHVRMLRPLEALRTQAPVSRATREVAAVEIVASDVRAPTFEDGVRNALAHGERSLVAIITELIVNVPAGQRFGAIGRITATVGREHGGRFVAPRNVDWADIGEVEVQDWELLDHAANAESAEP